MSQTELANKLGISQGAVSMIENGERNPSLELLYKMSQTFGVPIDDLIEKEAS